MVDRPNTPCCMMIPPSRADEGRGPLTLPQPTERHGANATRWRNNASNHRSRHPRLECSPALKECCSVKFPGVLLVLSAIDHPSMPFTSRQRAQRSSRCRSRESRLARFLTASTARQIRLPRRDGTWPRVWRIAQHSIAELRESTSPRTIVTFPRTTHPKNQTKKEIYQCSQFHHQYGAPTCSRKRFRERQNPSFGTRSKLRCTCVQ